MTKPQNQRSQLADQIAALPVSEARFRELWAIVDSILAEHDGKSTPVDTPRSSSEPKEKKKMDLPGTWVRRGSSGNSLHAVVFYDPARRRATTLCREEWLHVRDAGEPDSPLCRFSSEKVTERYQAMSQLKHGRSA